MTFSLKLIGELQYGFGIALTLIVILGIVFGYNHLYNKTHHSLEDYSYGLKQTMDDHNFTEKEKAQLIYTSNIYNPFNNTELLLFLYMLLSVLLGIFGLAIFMILQGIANIKLYRMHSEKLYK